MIFLTDFADQAVILPVVVAIGIALLAQRWPRGAAAWVLAVVVTFAAMLLLKLVFLAFSTNLGTDAIRTPSGHVAAATVVAGGLADCCFTDAPPPCCWLRWPHSSSASHALSSACIPRRR